MRLPLASQGPLGRLRVSVSRTSSWRGVFGGFLVPEPWFCGTLGRWQLKVGLHQIPGYVVLYLGSFGYLVGITGRVRETLCGGRCIFSRTDGLVGIPSGEDTSTCVGI